MKSKTIKLWIRYQFNQNKTSILVLSMLGVILSLTAIFFAYFSKETIDQAFSGSQALFLRSAIMIGAIMGTNVLFTTLNNYLKVYYRSKLEKKLKAELFEHLLKVDTKTLSRYHSGDLMTHLTSDVDILSDGMMDIIPRFIFYTTRFIGAFILIFLIDAMFSIIFLVLGLLLFVMSRLIAKPMSIRHRDVQEKESLSRAYMQESLEHIEIIKGYQVEDFFNEDNKIKQHKLFHAKLKRQRITLMTSTGMHGFFSFGYVFAIIFGAYRLDFGLTIGGLVALIQLVGHIQTPFSGMASLIPKYHQTLATAKRLSTLYALSEETHLESLYDLSFKSIEIKDLSFKYDQSDLIKNLNITINKGDIIQVVGPSGKGKTTLFKLLLALIHPNDGHMTIQQKDDHLPIGKSTRSFFSYVPQNLLILSGSIYDNLCFYKTYENEVIQNVLKTVELYDVILKLPEGLDTKLGEKGSGLSIGQLQRLAIARALLRDAPILLLDEITSALDQEIELKILENIKSLSHKTILISSHRELDSSLISERILL